VFISARETLLTSISEPQHARALAAVAEVFCEVGVDGFSTERVSERAGVSRETLDCAFETREALLLAAFEHALVAAGGSASAAYEAQEGWVDRIRAGLRALLEFFDREPELARFCVVGSAQAGPTVLARRCEVLDALARLLDDERAPARSYPPVLAAEAVVNGVLGVLQGRLIRRDPEVLVELCDSLMSFIVLPFLGARAARRELARPPGHPASVLRERNSAVDLLQDPVGRLTNPRTMRVLSVIGAEPGLNNTEVARRAEIKDPGQMSRLLSRLCQLGLIVNMRAQPASARAWQLTVSGERLESSIGREIGAPGKRVPLDLARAANGRLNHRAVSVLRALAAEPGLSNFQVALRTGVAAKSHTSRILARLARQGLIENTRTGGRENAWRLSASGKELEAALGV
jgi:AcrR family transcriptional regulator/predicted transcriptional regulator